MENFIKPTTEGEASSSFDPLALLKQNNHSDNPIRVTEAADSYCAPTYTVERKPGLDGAPLTVEDPNGKLLRSFTYNDKGEASDSPDSPPIYIIEPDYLFHNQPSEDIQFRTGIGRFGDEIFQHVHKDPLTLLGEIRIDPNNNDEFTLYTRRDWAERASGAKVQQSGTRIEVIDQRGQRIRTIDTDSLGIRFVDDADGASWVRNANGQYWNRVWPDRTFGGTAYNMHVDKQGNISYTTNDKYGSPDRTNPNPNNRLYNYEYIDGRVRVGPTESCPPAL